MKHIYINVCSLANTIDAYKRCRDSGNEFAEKHMEEIEKAEKELPHGSGIDAGVKIDYDKCNSEKLVFTFGFHFMNDNGYYDGWEDYVMTVTPSFLGGFKLKITGKNRRQIKDYLYNLFHSVFIADSNSRQMLIEEEI